MPTLGSYCCSQFVSNFLQIFREKKIREKEETSPFKLLIQASLLDESASICSFPEFVKRTKQAHKAHPVIRLARWVKMAYESKGTKYPDLSCLKRLLVVDQIGFPLILDTSGSSNSVINCDRFCKKGDFTDLQWMAFTVQHG